MFYKMHTNTWQVDIIFLQKNQQWVAFVCLFRLLMGENSFKKYLYYENYVNYSLLWKS